VPETVPGFSNALKISYMKYGMGIVKIFIIIKKIEFYREDFGGTRVIYYRVAG